MTDTNRRSAIKQGLAFGALLAAGTRLSAQEQSARLALFNMTGPVVGKVEVRDPTLSALIDADAQIETLVSGLNWCEGPTWLGGAHGSLFYSDVKGNRIHRFRKSSGDAVWLDPSGYVGPLFPDVIQEVGTNGLYATGHRLLACDSGNRCFVEFDPRTKQRRVLHDRFEGKRFNSPNDVVVSPRDGSIYFTDPCYGLRGTVASPARELDFMGIFRIDRDNVLSLVGKFDVPNGIGIAPDGGTLYATDRTRGWLAHTLDAKGAIVETRTFIDPKTTGISGGDGLRIDTHGNMWTSMLGGIAIIAPGGNILGLIRTNSVVSNCDIGADGYLYMSCNHQLARIPIKAHKLVVG